MKNYIFTLLGLLSLGLNLNAQTVDSIQSMLSSPTSNNEQLQLKMHNYMDTATNVDSNLLKTYSRHQSYFGAYVGSDGTINNFYPSFLTASTATSQPLPNIINCSNQSSDSWVSLGPSNYSYWTIGVLGRLTSVKIDVINNIVYAGSESGGLWKKPIGTDNWVNITDKIGYPALGIQDIAINPNNPNDIYCATAYGGYQGMHGYGIGLIHTRDGGNSWERINFSGNQYDKEAVSVAFTDFTPYTLFAGVGNELYRFDGTNFIEVFSTYPSPNTDKIELIRDIKFVAPQNGAQRKIVISTHEVFSWHQAKVWYHDLDNSNNVNTSIAWDSASLPDASTMDVKRVAIDISRSGTQRILASYGDNDNGGKVRVAKSDDLGATWSLIYTNDVADDGVNIYRNDVRISHNSDNIFYNASVPLMKTNKNTSVTTDDWVKAGNFHDDVRDIQIITRNGQEEIWVAHDGGLHRSTNGGTSWTKESANMAIGEFYDVGVAESHNRIIAGALDNANAYYNGQEWELMALKGDGSPGLFIKSNEDYSIFHSNGSVLMTNSSSLPANPNTWIQILNPPSGGESFWLNAPIVQHPIYDDHVLIGNHQLFDYDFTAHGNAGFLSLPTSPIINQISDPSVFGTNKITGIAMSKITENWIFVTKESGELFISTTKGAPNGTGWTDISNTVIVGSDNVLDREVHFTDVIFSPDNHNEIYLSVSGTMDDWYKVVQFTSGANGGWSDFTGALPNVAVHELEIYDAYPDNILLAATDLGVYYRILDGTSNWQCYNNGLPPTIVKNFEIKYCSNELYAATIGHGIYKVGLSGMLPEKTVDSPTPVIWNTNQTYYQDVHITPGTKLTIENATISMAGNAKIIVEWGAELVINNATITSACDAFWGGIEVFSDGASQHCSSGQTCYIGKVTINNSTIERAHCAIRTNYDGDIGGTSAGGVIKATNSHFLNNGRAVELNPFENHIPNTNTVIVNSSYFKNCTFEIDANFMFAEALPKNSMVNLNWVRGIPFRGCHFMNNLGEKINVVGITAYGAHFVVKDICSGFNPCTTTVKSSFSGLKAGILAHGLLYGNNSFQVDNATFEDNEYGVISSGISGAVITRNTFTPFPHSTSAPLHTSTTAIYFESSDQYTVEENHITGFSSSYQPTGAIPFTYGIVTKRSGSGSNKLYKNTFSQLSTANVAYGLNHDPMIGNEQFGLKYECNSISESVNGDIVIYGPDAGISTSQGSSAKGADNIFTSGMVVPDGHLRNNSTQSLPLTYYHHTQTGYNFEPVNISNNVVTQLVSGAFVENEDCKTHLGGFNQQNPGKMGPLEYTGKRSQITVGISGYNLAKYLYTSLIDGGDTYALLNTVQSSNTQNAWDVRTDLINASPLSIEILHETIDEGLLLNALLHDVLMENPHGVRDEEIMFKLENKTVPMPAYMINTLLGIYETQTQKDVLEAQMAFELQEAHEAARFLTLHWAVDSLNPLNDSILIINDSLNTPAADWTSVAHHITKGNYTTAQNMIEAMPNKFVFSDYEDINYNELNSYYTNYIAMLQDDMGSFEKPNPTQLANLQLLAADSTTKAGRMAQNLILFAEGNVFWPTLPEESENKKEANNPRKKRTVLPSIVATVYPNPTSEYVTIQFTDINTDEPLLIKVITSTGTEVLTHSETLQNGGLINLMTKTLASGQYFVLIYQNNTLLQKQALEIIH